MRHHINLVVKATCNRTSITLVCWGRSRECLAVDVRGTWYCKRSFGVGCGCSNRLNPSQSLVWWHSRSSIRAGRWGCLIHFWLRDDGGRGVCGRIGKSFRMAKVRLGQGLCVRRWLRRWRRWGAVKRNGFCSRRAVLWRNVCAARTWRKTGAVLRRLDIWLSFTGSNVSLLVWTQHRQLSLRGFDVWVTADFPCREWGLWSCGVLFGHRQSCLKGKESPSYVIISHSFLYSDRHYDPTLSPNHLMADLSISHDSYFVYF